MRLFLLIAAVLAIASFPFVSNWISSGNFTTSKGKPIEEQIEDYINTHPDKILHVLQNYQMKEMRDTSAARSKDLLSKHADAIRDLSYPHVGEDKSLPVVLEFSSYMCQHCKDAEPGASKFIDEYVAGNNPKAVYVFRVLYMPSVPESVFTAKALLAVNALEPGKARAFHSAMLKNASSDYNKEFVIGEVKRLGIDEAAFTKKVESDELDAQLKANMDLAIALEISGTPTFVAGDKIVVGAQSVLESLAGAIGASGVK